MSSLSARRLKDRDGAGISVTAARPSKSQTPLSQKVSGDVFMKSSSGKENFGSSSKVLAISSQKPVIRPMPRIEKRSSFGSGTSDGDSNNRRSTSSVPRGRISSPSESIRFLSDLKKNQGPGKVLVDGRSVSRGRKAGNGADSILQKKGVRDSSVKRSENGIRVFRDGKDSVNHRVDLDEKKENLSDGKLGLEIDERGKLSFSNGVGILDIWKEIKLGSNLNNLSKTNVNVRIGRSKDRFIVDSNLKDKNFVEDSYKIKEKSCLSSTSDGAIEKIGNGFDTRFKKMREKSSSNLKVSKIMKEKGLSEEVLGSRVGVKYSSKLHERLAFLEGKVKRIASDIKQTKEMLDTNNPNASKVILSDIQDKISGIEKAMGRVGSGSIGAAKTENDNGRSKMVDTSIDKQVDSVKGLNTEELEARLFPHHKLLRDRTSLKASSGSSQSQQPEIPGSSSESKMEAKSLSSIDENPIALEFLASLNKEQCKVTTRNEHGCLELCNVQEMDGAATAEVHDTSSIFNGKHDVEIILTTNETLDEFDDQGNRRVIIIDEEIEDACFNQLNEIGSKTSTAGWFVSEGESVLLAHDDGSCTFYDIANCETKAEYKPPTRVSSNVWRDCWIIRASDADGCSGRYVVAASAGNTMDSGFCSWDFYTKDVRAFHIEDGNPASRTALAPLPNDNIYRRNTLSTHLAAENRQWWYKPCGQLIISTASCQPVVKIFDIRDGEQIMKWEIPKPVLAMDFSSPLQWRNRGKVVIAEAETIALWDVCSLNPQALLSVSLSGRKISALHVNNTDAELGGGVRQRVSSSEAEGNDGVCCTTDFINILDFRHPSGVGLKIPKLGVCAHSVFSRGDSVFLGCTQGKKQFSQLQQFSLRKQRLISTYAMPESNAHSHYTAITQVWGNSNLVMGVCGLGMFVFDAMKDDGLQSFTDDPKKVRETIGPDDLYSPSFDYSSTCALLVSRDRPALWRHLS